MANEILSNVLDKKTIKLMWKMLESLYITKSLSNKLFMKKQLFRLMMPKGSDFMERLNKFNMMITQLSTVGGRQSLATIGFIAKFIRSPSYHTDV